MRFSLQRFKAAERVSLSFESPYPPMPLSGHQGFHMGRTHFERETNPWLRRFDPLRGPSLFIQAFNLRGNECTLL
jgi:hypothetical protein